MSHPIKYILFNHMILFVFVIYFSFVGVFVDATFNATSYDYGIIRTLDNKALDRRRRLSSLNLLSSSENNTQIDERQRLAESIILTKNASNSIYHYIKKYCNQICHEFMILVWDKDGNLDQYSLKDNNHGWWNGDNYYDKTKSSNYGTIAILLNSDILQFYTKVGKELKNWKEPWEIIPPVPILSWSIPKEYYDQNHYHHLLPTPYDRNGFTRWLNKLAIDAMKNSTYNERKNVIIWRGAIHGHDHNRLILTKMSSENNNSITWLDAKDTTSIQENYMSMEDMVSKYKYQIDIGGESGTSWGGLRWKMCTGNLVFKVNSWSKDWWHDMIRPYKHYIPVQDDLSDLYDVYQWVENNPLEVNKIRLRGMKRCQDTIREHFIINYEIKILKQLQPIPNQELLDEVQLIRDGYLSYN